MLTKLYVPVYGELREPDDHFLWPCVGEIHGSFCVSVHSVDRSVSSGHLPCRQTLQRIHDKHTIVNKTRPSPHQQSTCGQLSAQILISSCPQTNIHKFRHISTCGNHIFRSFVGFVDNLFRHCSTIVFSGNIVAAIIHRPCALINVSTSLSTRCG